MKKILKTLAPFINAPEEQIRKSLEKNTDSSISFYKSSIYRRENEIVAMARDQTSRFLLVISKYKDGISSKFAGEQIKGHGLFARVCPLSEENAVVVRELFPWTMPVSLRKKKASVGCGDRLGLATPGHIAAVREFDVSPVLAQQSIRELTLTGRTYRNVVDDTTFAVYQCGYKDGYGADGDHLKTIADIDLALAADMPMITLDLSGVVFAEAGNWDGSQVDSAYRNLPGNVQTKMKEAYFDRVFHVSSLSIRMDIPTVRRCAVMYLRAMDFISEAYQHLMEKRRNDFDLEISIDETVSPTLPEHHLFIANELKLRGVEINSLAPKFIGDFQKGIDYIGDVKEFSRQFAEHCEISKAFGNYKISIHSGSDKFKVFPAIGKVSNMHFHAKTAGTSWLEAVRVIAAKSPELYRTMHKRAIEKFKDALKLYHITGDISKIPDIDSMRDEELPDLMNMDEARQLLHITYGSILTSPAIRPAFFFAMHKYEDIYHDKIKGHFLKHLKGFGIPARKDSEY